MSPKMRRMLIDEIADYQMDHLDESELYRLARASIVHELEQLRDLDLADEHTSTFITEDDTWIQD